ncbi:hypothetical protein HHK36_005779 [Tetracentron sinense]|uniref:histidine kinase n=1 Tax=Tetracentron sinense TaxID=13715 RepID=A0A834ZLP7_TETSI|nr:hypothetical protein HHK36_005779 [Tetracentron sinense]
MSSSAISGDFLKLPRLFLKICRWVLVKMALNCKLSSFKGRVSANSKLTKAKEQLQGSNGACKWRRKFLVLLVGCVIGSIWICSGLKGISWGKEKTLDSWEVKARILQEQFNVTKKQLHALASVFSKSDQVKAPLDCREELGFEIPLSDGIACALEVLCSERQKFEKLHKCVAETLEAKDQCPVQDEYIPKKLDPSSLREESVSLVFSQDTTSSILPDHQIYRKKADALRNCTEEYCESIPICLVKICWWVLVGMMASCMISGFWEKLWTNLKQKQVQQQKQQQLSQSPSKGGGKWRKKLLVLFVLVGVIGSFWLFWHLNEDIILRRKQTLANMCDERARMLQDQFNVSLNHVHALAILVSTFHHGKQPSAIDQKTFGEYTERTAFERPLTSGVAYALKVLHSEREQFEKHHGWAIKKMETEDQSSVQDYIPEKLDASPIQDEYAPVIFSQETVSHIVSIDMMSGKEDRDNILRARASGKGVLTSPFKLLKSNHLGVVLTFAVYNTDLPLDATPEHRIEATMGYLGASYDVPSLVEKLLHQLASKQTIVVNVYDTTNLSAPINMYGPKVANTGLLHISNLDFGDPSRKHEMHCRFKQKPPPPWTAITASLGVLVITLLLGHIFHAAVNRIAKVEGDYREMMELKVRAEAADVAKSQFLATVSHEIRTPMNGVLGMLQMLMDTELATNQQEFARTAHSSGKDLISVINEVLDQAKIESGRLELEAVPFDLCAVLDDVLSLLSRKSQAKGIEVKLSFHLGHFFDFFMVPFSYCCCYLLSPLPKFDLWVFSFWREKLAVYVSDHVPEVVIGDPGRFRQIITNLVGNSLKFTEKGHIFITVHLADEVRYPSEVRDVVLKQSLELFQNGLDTSKNTLSGFPVVDRWKSWENFKMLSGANSIEPTELIRLLVTVEDTGVGIPQDAQSRIFMPFMQADSSTSRTYGGTGIGLSVSKCLVDLMSGEIGFVSKPRTGSTFTFTAAFTKGQTCSLNTKRHQYESAIADFRGLRGLVVDGKNLRAEVTRYHLQRLGISVDIAISLSSACSYISNNGNTSSSVHLDMVLVEKDAWGEGTNLALPHLLKELRQNGRAKLVENHLKIFLLVTSVSRSELNEFKSAGCVDDVILKPLHLSMMMTCFQQALGVGNKGQLNRGETPSLRSLLGGKRILVVDDNVVNRRVAEGALKKYGAIVTCVESGKAALGMLKPPHNFDACFMDLQMPEMDGFEATRKIRSIENKVNEKIELGEVSIEMCGNVVHWHTPILAMTADMIQETHEECIKCGMDDYVLKPFEEEQLYSAVAHFF